VFCHLCRKTAEINVKKRNSLNLVLKTPTDTSKTANINNLIRHTLYQVVFKCHTSSLIAKANISSASVWSSVHVKDISICKFIPRSQNYSVYLISTGNTWRVDFHR
jgi:hypothetical protein